jgi:Lrp/AsnC family leucine-responsive transcriptional regulator
MAPGQPEGAVKIANFMDENDWKLLQALQRNPLSSSPDLAQKVGLSAQVVRRRKRWMEEVGIISGYHVEVDPKKVGLVISAVLRVSVESGNVIPLRQAIASSPEVRECDRTIGTDSFIMKVLVGSTEALEGVIDRFLGFGSVSSTVVTSSPVKKREISRILVEPATEGDE